MKHIMRLIKINNPQFGPYVYSLRKRQKKTQTTASKQIGIAPCTLIWIEKGRFLPRTLETVFNISEVYNTDMTILLKYYRHDLQNTEKITY